MPYYKALFRLAGDKELEASHGYVPDAFFDAAQKATVDDIVVIYEGGFALTTEMHEKLNFTDRYTSYASVAKKAPEGSENMPEFRHELLQLLKNANHARPLETRFHYQVFIMEHIETPPEDD